MKEAAQSLVVGPAKAVNPKIKVVIKYPNWYEHFPYAGFNLEAEPRIFDGIYTGTETRDPVLTHQHLQTYQSYSIMRYFENVKPGGNGGGWVDPFARITLDRYAEQIALTVLAKAREITLFCFSDLLEPDPPARRLDDGGEPRGARGRRDAGAGGRPALAPRQPGRRLGLQAVPLLGRGLPALVPRHDRHPDGAHAAVPGGRADRLPERVGPVRPGDRLAHREAAAGRQVGRHHLRPAEGAPGQGHRADRGPRGVGSPRADAALLELLERRLGGRARHPAPAGALRDERLVGGDHRARRRRTASRSCTTPTTGAAGSSSSPSPTTSRTSTRCRRRPSTTSAGVVTKGLPGAPPGAEPGRRSSPTTTTPTSCTRSSTGWASVELVADGRDVDARRPADGRGGARPAARRGDRLPGLPRSRTSTARSSAGSRGGGRGLGARLRGQPEAGPGREHHRLRPDLAGPREGRASRRSTSRASRRPASPRCASTCTRSGTWTRRTGTP